MARSRNIKPGFFVNADLVELPPLVRLLFIGLWTVADREGRLEDRPSQIKMQVLPGDDVDTGQALDMLGASHFLTRYEVGGKKYIQISNFSKHQNPHMKEPKSVIPPIPENAEPADMTKGNASQIPASCKHRACLVLAGLIPDSLLLIPVKPNDDNTRAEIPFEQVRLAYNKFCPSLPNAIEMSGSTRWLALRHIWTKYKDHKGGPLVFLDTLFKKAEASDTITNRNGAWRGHPANIDWLLKEENYINVIEGKYDNRSGGKQKPRATGPVHGFDDELTQELLSHGRG